MKINFINDLESSGESNCEVHLLYKVGDDIQLSQSASILDQGTDGLLNETLGQNKFKGKFLDSFFITSNNLPCHDALFISVGDPVKLDDAKLEKIGGAVYTKLQERGTQGRVLVFTDKEIKTSVSNIAFGMQLKQYKFDKYFTKKDKEETDFDVDVCQEGVDLTKLQDEYTHKNAMVEGIAFAKDLISESPMILVIDRV